ncbi:hypothetical protein, partial [Vibrio sp. 10N.261.49.A11]|uniref:hypothetical protein n=1 Tax=Vibrio sp. 10N.261.49.A11 TaxID=3229666 RepID=UPI00354BE64D
VSRQFASFQAYEVQSHDHGQGAMIDFGSSGAGSGFLAEGGDQNSGSSSSNEKVVGAGGVETRPRNVSFPILIEV